MSYRQNPAPEKKGLIASLFGAGKGPARKPSGFTRLSPKQAALMRAKLAAAKNRLRPVRRGSVGAAARAMSLSGYEATGALPMSMPIYTAPPTAAQRQQAAAAQRAAAQQTAARLAAAQAASRARIVEANRLAALRARARPIATLTSGGTTTAGGGILASLFGKKVLKRAPTAAEIAACRANPGHRDCGAILNYASAHDLLRQPVMKCPPGYYLAGAGTRSEGCVPMPTEAIPFKPPGGATTPVATQTFDPGSVTTTVDSEIAASDAGAGDIEAELDAAGATAPPPPAPTVLVKPGMTSGAKLGIAAVVLGAGYLYLNR